MTVALAGTQHEEIETRWSAHWGPDPRDRLRRLLSEFLGVFLLVFVLSGGAATLTKYADMPGWAVGVTLSFAAGLILLAAIFFLGDISAHFDPAVTLAFALRREVEWFIALAYFVVQFAGAACGSLVVRAFIGNYGNLARTDPQPGQAWGAVGWEAILTGGLVLMVLGIAGGPQLNQRFIPFAVAGYIAVMGSIGGPFDGASMNPARSFGPALATLDFSHYWVYVLGPCIGAIAAVSIAAILRDPPGEKAAVVPESEAPPTGVE
jgi:MIP family channel proteins